MHEPTSSGPGLRDTLRRVVTTVLAVLQNRFELLLVEWQEERQRLVHVLLLVAAVAGLAFLALVAFGVAVLVLVWEQYRIGGLLAVGVLCLLGALATYWLLRRRLREWSPFSSSLAELKKDRASIEHKS